MESVAAQSSTKVFSGRNSREVLNRIREECGDEVEILSTRFVEDKGSRTKKCEIVVNVPSSLPSVPVVAATPKRTVVADLATHLEQLVLTNGLSPHWSRKLSHLYREHAQGRERLDSGIIARILASSLGFQSYADLPKRLAVLGPTGVGKTTTVAKLAAAATAQGKSVGLITVDRYRVGAVQHLERFSDVLQIPMLEAESSEVLQQALQHFERKDLVLVDTGGVSPRDVARQEELRNLLHGAGVSESLLLISASGNLPDYRGQLQSVISIKPRRIGISKIDETVHFGPCLSFLLESRLPLCLFGNGPRVPEHLLDVSPEICAELLLRGTH